MGKLAGGDTFHLADEEVCLSGEQWETKKTPLILKLLAILLIIAAVFAVPPLVLILVTMIAEPFGLDTLGVTSFVISLVLSVSLLANSVLGALLGINLLRRRMRFARHTAEILIAISVVAMICEIMLNGLSLYLLTYLIRLVILIAVGTYIDPTLSEERKVQRALRKMETRDEAAKGVLGRDESGRGYLKLDFCNIFWIFVIGCVVGVIIETLFHLATTHEYMNRAGMLYGPFSPIYGFGAVLMTVALNRFYKKSIILIFLFTALIGGAFEYSVSWFFEFAFGIVAWDYSGTFLSIDGRTDGLFMCFWGLLGCVWIKFLLPSVLKLVNLIPWNLRYSATTVFAALMLLNGGLTLAAFDSWYQRQADSEPTNALEEFCDEFYDDTFMEDRFQTMSIDPSKSTRT
ncbi:MAG: putative ABC transporter permease [Coriobacteriales bacterium]|jgi:hypothetical protein|nr:putative ABC transporter permease [Coriobacteriales bacterium]